MARFGDDAVGVAGHNLGDALGPLRRVEPVLAQSLRRRAAEAMLPVTTSSAMHGDDACPAVEAVSRGVIPAGKGKVSKVVVGV
jgi:hypothetical protein